MELVVGTDSTWSLRALICSHLAKIKLDLKIIDLQKDDYKSEILKYSPSGLVPVLITSEYVIHDSLAITEFLNEYSEGCLYPNSQQNRAISRSLCAELHSGFINIRNLCPFTLDKVPPCTELDENTQNEIGRISAIFEKAVLPFMFESPGAVDAFYSIMAFRLKIYGIALKGKTAEYQQCLLNWPVLKMAINLAIDWKKR